MKEDNVIHKAVEYIIQNYLDGQLITHDWLRERCGFDPLRYDDYGNVSDLFEAFKAQQFQYMTVVDNIRSILLNDHNRYLKNCRGWGYVILNPKDQVTFGYERFVDGLKKLMKETNLIMNNVCTVNGEQQAKDNDLRAKYAAMKMMLETIKK